MTLVVSGQALLAALDAADPDAVLAALADTTVMVRPLDRTMSDGAELAALVGHLLAAVPDLRVRAVRTHPGERSVAAEVLIDGTLTGPCPWWPTTGRHVEMFGRLVWVSHPGSDTTLEVFFDGDDALVQAGLTARTATGSGPGTSGWAVAMASEAWWDTPHTIPAAPPVRPTRRRRRAGVIAALAGVVAVGVVAGVGWSLLGGQAGVGARTGTTGAAMSGAGAPASGPGPNAPVVASRRPSASASSATASSATPSSAPPSSAAPVPITPEVPVSLSAAVLFDFDEAVLRPDAAPILTDLAARVRVTGRVGTVTVTGYTDDIGSDAYASQLSLARAQAVSAVLRGLLGDTELQIIDVGAGKTDPVAPNDSERNRAANRRVEVSFLAG